MLRSLSTRILAGFGLLTITFAVVVGVVVFYIRQLEDQLVLIGEGYVRLAFECDGLKDRQDDLRAFLATADAAHVRELRHRRDARDLALQRARKVVRAFDSSQFTISRPRLDTLERDVAATAPLYDAARDSRGLAALREAEQRIWLQASVLAEVTERGVTATRKQLEANERTVRIRTIVFGASGVALGLVLMVWVVITLRPLRVVREGSRRIASGDYANRIPERGPSELIDLAREFNAMASAIVERERERVRAERLAAIGKVAAMIAHEVRNPLTSISLKASQLDDHVGDNAEARELCSEIHREVDRLTAVTEKCLGLARVPEPALASEAINTVVGAFAGFVRDELAAKQVALAIELDPEDPIALVDADQVRQCLINLVRNAADAIGDRRGTITLRTRHAGDSVEISVTDTGSGIPPEALARLFDPFFSTKQGGTGLGLALTQELVRGHGGDLVVATEVDRGTTFTIRVPAVRRRA